MCRAMCRGISTFLRFGFLVQALTLNPKALKGFKLCNMAMQVERLKARVKALREEADHAEAGRRA